MKHIFATIIICCTLSGCEPVYPVPKQEVGNGITAHDIQHQGVSYVCFMHKRHEATGLSCVPN